MIRQLFAKPENVFAVLALVLGLALCFLLPVGAGFDEGTHLARIWQISGGELLPNQTAGANFPDAFNEVSYRSRFFYTPVTADYFAQYANKTIDWDVFSEHETRSVYFPAFYMPQAFVAGLLGRVVDAPVLLIYYLARITELLGYVVLAYLAIRLIPFGKWVLAVLALSPVAMLQAVTISTDPYTNGVAFLMLAWVLALRFQARPIDGKQVALTLGLVALLFFAKPGVACLVVLLVLLPRAKFANPRALLWLWGGAGLLFLVLVLGWNLFAYNSFSASQGEADAMAQVGYILSAPLAFMGVLVRDLAMYAGAYLTKWTAVYPYEVAPVPALLYPLYWLVLGLTLLLDNSPHTIDAFTRRVLLAAFALGVLFTIGLLYITFTPVGAAEVSGVQGRYFIPMMPLLALALVPHRQLLPAPLTARRVAQAGAVLSLLVYAAGMYLVFYVTCGSSYYLGGNCYQPVYRNWDPAAQFSPPLEAGGSLQQSFVAACQPIVSVRLWAEDATAARGGNFVLRTQDGAVLNLQPLSLAQREGNMLEFSFSPLPVRAGDTVLIEVEAEKPSTLRLAVSSRLEYSDGQFSINGFFMPHDLIFQYSCQR